MRARPHRWLAPVGVAAALALLVLAAFDLARLTLEAGHAIDSISEVRWHVDSAVANASELHASSNTLKSATARLTAIERRLDRYGPVLAVTSIVPPLGRRIEEAQALLAIHVDLSSAAAESLDMAAGLMDRLTGTSASPDEPLRALVDTLKAERETIRAQLTIVDRASRRLDGIATTARGQFSDPQTEALRDTIGTLRTTLQAALLAPQSARLADAQALSAAGAKE